jgi:putative membrane protein
MITVNWAVVLSSIIFAVVGIVVFALGFFILDVLTPYHLWKEINEKQNTALAIFVGALAIGLAIIIAAAIHG